ncbi:Fe-S cluster assembly protein SufD [Algoriphagus kandeliae]|uniref:Fe-S cluster assembly protein SufD n=1 Tax=Algoriphagus kandeliae TaxID=2562278 RepID=A0A4Y9R1H6_9BACT|nr:Fe-S cluster assembly protein SufD [Algoriphagus kandeliae]TFV97176.1 Fe-S cluster assembly protein SufD [Algoriphagus kandeliae]
MNTLTTQDTFDVLLESAPQNFSVLRAAGKELYQAAGLPAAKAEEYKFTAITKKLEKSISDFRAAAPISISQNQITESTFKGFDGYILVFSNGKFLPELSSQIEGVQVGSLEENNEGIGTIAKAEKDAFAALNQATFSGGISITVPKKIQVDKPILLLSFNQSNEGQVITPRFWIEVGDFAEVTFIDQSVGLGDSSYFINKVVEAKGGINSQINYYRLQHEGDQVIEVSNIETDVQADARFTSVNISLSGDMVRNNLSLNLLGSNCEGNMYGIYLLNGKTHVDNHTNVDHTIPHAESNELYKGIFDGQSRGVFNGKIFVRQDAQKTNAFQQNNNVLLSQDAIVNTKPQLEIWADDVKCSHGCTVGQLDEEALFYLQARGIDKTLAKGLLLYAFVGEVLEKIEDESFKNHVVGLITNRLGSKF